MTALNGDPLDVVLLEVVEQPLRRSGLVEREYMRGWRCRRRGRIWTTLLPTLLRTVIERTLQSASGIRDARSWTWSRAEAFDLVVMATRGRSGLGRVVLGSVAEDVLRTATVPLLLIGPGLLATKLTSPNAVSKRGLAAHSRAVAETTGGIVG
ncbi:MAG: universal stress protein [Thermomicrobiales bacterium]|nr:universal stress protein [Thermomicrobiales bacterium]